MTDFPDYQPEPLPDQSGEDDSILEYYRDEPDRPIPSDPSARFIDDLLTVIRQANAPRPLVILEREQADFLRNLLLDLVAGNETARYAVDRLRIGLDLLDGRTRQ